MEIKIFRNNLEDSWLIDSTEKEEKKIKISTLPEKLKKKFIRLFNESAIDTLKQIFFNGKVGEKGKVEIDTQNIVFNFEYELMLFEHLGEDVQKEVKKILALLIWYLRGIKYYRDSAGMSSDYLPVCVDCGAKWEEGHDFCQSPNCPSHQIRQI